MDLLTYPFDGALILQKKRALKKELLAAPGLVDKKVAILSGSTIGDIRPVLELFLLNAGIRPSFHEGAYGLFYEELVFDNAALAAFAPDVVYIHTSARNVRHWPAPADTEDAAAEKLDAEYARFSAAWQAAKALGCPVIQNNFEEPGFRNFGSMDAWDARGRTRFVRRLNEKMADYAAANPGFYIHDFAWLAATQGLDAFCDDAAWYGYKYALAPAYIPALCHSLAGLIKSLFGRVKKAVVSDLDNTLWGGVIGEEGPEGVLLGDESPSGMAYARFQEYLALLSQRGILLTVASKNEEAAAAAGFARADSPLKREDFLCFEANWQPKSASIARIAESLNIGADSLVFVDDNPAEREEVTCALPMVQAPAVGQPENSIRLLDRGGYFEVSSLSADDAKRAEMYRQNARRAAQQHSFANYGAYLQSLEMRAEIVPFQPQQLERVTQLINKTNQFNFTTRRYTLEEVARCAASAENTITLSARLTDKFGDNGITAALIARKTGSEIDIELWVMSCRVFGRHLEYAVFDALVARAKQMGAETITGRYRPTAKNLPVRDFYATIGFELVGGTEDERVFRYTIPAVYENRNTVIEVER